MALHGQGARSDRMLKDLQALIGGPEEIPCIILKR